MVRKPASRKPAKFPLVGVGAEWSTTFDAITDALCLVDLQGTVQRCNKAFAMFVGRTPEEIVGEDCCALIHGGPDHPSEWPLPKALETKAHQEAEYVVGDRWVRAAADPAFDDAGAVIGAVHSLAVIDERKRAEQALQQSEARFQLLARAAPVGIFQTDERGSTVYVNQRWTEISGLSADQALGHGWLQSVHPEDRERLTAGWENALREGHESLADYRFLRPDGTVAWVIGHAVAVADATGRVTGYIGTITDITERRRLDDALRESEERYRTLVESADEAIFVVGRDLRFQFVNGVAAKQLGGRGEEIVGKRLDEVFAPPSAEQASAANLQVLESGLPLRFEETINVREGERILDTTLTPLRNARGEVVSVIGMARDITDRVMAEKGLRASEEQYRTLVAHSPDGIFLVDLKGNFLSVNEALCRGLGFGEAEMLSMSLWDIVPEGQWETHKARLARILKGESLDATVEYEVRDKAGKLVPIEVRSGPYRKGEEIVGFQAIARDITERRRAEAQLRYQAALLANVNDAIVASDAQYRITAWNAAAESLYGWKAEEVLGQPGLAITQTECPGTDKATFLRTLAEAGRWRGEVTQARRDGTRVPVEISSIGLRDESGQITGYVSVNRDISERKQAEETLRAERLKVNMVTRSIGAGLAVISREYRTVWANDVLKKVFGDVEGKFCYLTYNQRDAVCQDCGVKRVFEQGVEVAVHEQSGKNVQGETIWSQIIATPIRDDKGNITEALELVVPITDRKRAEEELKRRNEELERFNRATSGREMRMIELKQKVNELSRQLGLPPPYPLAFLPKDGQVAADPESFKNNEPTGEHEP